MSFIESLKSENLLIRLWLLSFQSEVAMMYNLDFSLWKCNVKFQLLFTTEKTELTGLAIGISSMKSGERALLHVGWELGYGKEGNFSFPNVPPMADIVYEVELIGFDETKEVSVLCLGYKDFSYMLEPFNSSYHIHENKLIISVGL